MNQDLKHPFVHETGYGIAVHYEQADRRRIVKDLEAQGDAIGLIRIIKSSSDMHLQKAVKDRAEAALKRLEKKAKTYAAMAQMRERRMQA